MATWIEVRARYDKMMENGSVKKVTEPYLADALSCTEAEARVTEELQPFISGDFRISSVVTTKIAEIFWDETGDKFYKVKINFITLDEKTATEKKTASYILVPRIPSKKPTTISLTECAAPWPITRLRRLLRPNWLSV